MTQPVKPIRAWATYDKWMWMADPYDEGGWRVFAMPLTGEGEEFVTGLRSIPYTVERLAYMLPLRSLRVLFDNGYTLVLHGWPNAPHDRTSWEWRVNDPNGDLRAEGEFTEDKDHEAVERAVIASAAVFNPTVSGDA